MSGTKFLCLPTRRSPYKKTMRNISVIVLSWLLVISFFLGGCGKTEAPESSALSSSDNKVIAEYVRTVAVSEAVGQLLMVGLPADINTVRDRESQDVDAVVMRRQVGFVIPKAYTYYDDGRLQPDEYLSKIVDFNNAIQAKALKGPLGLPVLFATDFEGPTITPIKRGLLPPPSALAMGATQDQEALIEVGGMVGFQLRNIGIHILLGPVLDICNVRQGNRNTLQDRCFASTPDGVARTASNYLSGIKQSGLAIFAKHYPSHGSIETDPHLQIIPRYEGSTEQRAGELKPFELNKLMIDGIMTSHIEVEMGQGGKIATFSSELLEEAKKKDLGDKIYITDDLSEMGAIQKYKETNHVTYADIAIQAFDAGHDVLLFAHLGKGDDEKRHDGTFRPSNFKIQDMETVLDRLTSHITSNPAYEKQFRSSLEKILRLKGRIAKQQRHSVAQMLKKGNRESPFHIPYSGQLAIENIEKDLENLVSRHTTQNISRCEQQGIREQIVMSSLKKSAVIIKQGKWASERLLNHANDSEILFAAYDSDIDKFKDAFSPHFPKSKYFSIPATKNTAAFRKFEQAIGAAFAAGDMLVYTVYDESDADLLMRLRHRHGSDFAKKMLILLHGSPAILDSALIGDIAIIGSFTRHPLSINVDIDILSDLTKARGLENLPVNVGENGKYYSVSNTRWVPPADDEKFEKVFLTRELDGCLPIIKQKYIVVPRNITSFGLLFFILTIGAAIAVLPPKFVRRYEKRQVAPWVKPFGEYVVTGLISVIVVFLLLVVVFFHTQLHESIRQRAILIDDIYEIKDKLGRKTPLNWVIPNQTGPI